MTRHTFNNKNSLFTRPNWIIIVNIIITLLILSLLFIANDSLVIKLFSLWDNELSRIIYINTSKLCWIFSIPGKNIGINIFTFLVLVFNFEMIIIKLCILLCQNFNIILLILLSLWFSTALTKNFWAKHILKSNADLISKFFYVLENKKYTFILVSIAITIFIVFISRLISRSAVCFLLGGVNPSLDILSYSLMILLSWPLLWYMANIIQKWLGIGQKGKSTYSKQRLTDVDFEFCNPYVVEKVNLYAISLNLIINYLITINLYWSSIFICIIICISYLLIKYGNDIFMYCIYINPANIMLFSSGATWEGLLAIAAVLSTGLAETDWSTVGTNSIVYRNHHEEFINGTWNWYSGHGSRIRPGRAFREYNKDESLRNLRSQTRQLLNDNGVHLPYIQYKYNTSFSAPKFQGFSLNSYITHDSNTLIMFIRSYQDNSVKYVPSFFNDPGLKNVDRDLREKFGIFTLDPHKYSSLILFTQEHKIEDSPFVRVWRPLPYSHMPFRDRQKNNYFHLGIDTTRSETSMAGTIPRIEYAKTLLASKLDDYHKWQYVNAIIEEFVVYYVLLAKKNNDGRFDVNLSTGYTVDWLKDIYINYHDWGWSRKLLTHNKNHNLRLYKKDLVAQPGFWEVTDRIFVGNVDKLDFEAHELINEDTGKELYSIIDTRNTLRWEKISDGENKEFVLYKDSYNIFNDEDNTSIIQIIGNHFNCTKKEFD